MAISADTRTVAEHASLTLSARLKLATRAEHDSLESIVPLMAPAMDVQSYAGYMRCLWAFYELLERSTLEVSPGWFENMGLVRRVPLIEADLAALEVTVPDPILHRAGLPLLQQYEERLGVYYVLEGSALGARVIRSHLAQNAAIDVDRCARFFDPYGEAMPVIWKRFRQHLDRYSDIPAASEVVIQSARHTFAFYEAWLRRAGYPLQSAAHADSS